MNTNTAFTGSYSENPLWYHRFDFGQVRILRGGQPIVELFSSYNCCPYVTTMKAMNFKDDIHSIPFDNFKDYYALVYDLTSRQDTAENIRYPELVEEPLRLLLKLEVPLGCITELIVLGERISSDEVDNLGVAGKNV